MFIFIISFFNFLGILFSAFLIAVALLMLQKFILILILFWRQENQ